VLSCELLGLIGQQFSRAYPGIGELMPRPASKPSDSIPMKSLLIPTVVLTLGCVFLSGCETADGESMTQIASKESKAGQLEEAELTEGEHGAHTITVINPVETDVVTTQEYVCQIHSRRHVDVCSLDGGYLQTVHVQEGQAVKKGDVLFEILPTLYRAELDAKLAEVQTAKVELEQSRKLLQDKIVSPVDVRLHEAKVAKAEADAKVAEANLKFTEIRAPFDGIIDRQIHQQGSLIGEGEILTTLSDNEVMWVYFNVPEARYLEYMASQGERDPEHPQRLKLPGAQIGVRLADGSTFNQTAGDVVTVEGNFDNETGNIAFRADFPNPDHLLRHGQTGTIMIHRTLHNAIVIPQRATYEVLDKQFVFVIDGSANPAAEGGHQDAAQHGSRSTEERESLPVDPQSHGQLVGQDAEHNPTRAHGHGVVHQRHIVIGHEKDDVFIIESGLSPKDQVVLEGVRQVHDGQETDYEVENPKDVFANLKYHAE
jgi:membrane fusion protein (multidrug efflux system)